MADIDFKTKSVLTPSWITPADVQMRITGVSLDINEFNG